MSEGPLRVWVDDGHPIFRRGLVACLVADGYSVVGESSALQPVPDPGALDTLIFEADGGGLAQAARLVRGYPVRLVAVAMSADELLISDAIETGVNAVLVRRDLSPKALVGALRAISNGSAAMPAVLLPKLLERAANGSLGGARALSERELGVLRLLADGSDTRDIADEMCYSERTVKNIVHDLLMKMNCRNRAHAVALATRQGFI